MQGEISDSGVFRMLAREHGAATQPILVLSDCDHAATAVSGQFEFLGVNVRTSAPGELPSAVDAASPPLAVVLVVNECSELIGPVLEEITVSWPELPVVVHQYGSAEVPARIAAHPQVVSLLQAPVRFPQLVGLLRELRLIRSAGGLRDSRHQPELFRSLVGRSPGVQAVRHMISRVAPSEASVLVLGETGTGKEVVARNIHYHSPRRGGPFVAVNCGAIPGELLESELFGHEKGAFTGAVSSRKGRFELAGGGTLFLDEIGDMPLDMQVKLLRVLQERRFERLGAARSQEADVRIVAATHRDLERMIAEGAFREDLYYRLNVVSISMPPLRHRREDLPLLIAELNAQLQRRGMPAAHFGQAALRALGRHSWPGNVRELANLVERCAILSPDKAVELHDLPEKLQQLVDAEESARLATPDEQETTRTLGSGLVANGGEGVAFSEFSEGGTVELKSLLESLEVRLIRQALEEANGVVAQAAKMLGLRRTTLVEKMRKFQIERGSDETDGGLSEI
jgi:sigma-54 dependent transcriptional regulator, flagellar regulatory protein